MSIRKALALALKKFESNNALFTGNDFYSYGLLRAASSNIAGCLLSLKDKSNAPVAVMGKGGFFTYSGICGTILSGCYYVPLNENFPVERNLGILQASGAKIIILDTDDFSGWEKIAGNIEGYDIITRSEHKKRLSIDYPSNRFNDYTEFNGLSDDFAYDESGDTFIYLLFTSGSTGKPKGIRISQDNLSGYAEAFCHRNIVDETYRLIQMNDLTFDLSAHSLFLSFLKGACLYVPDKIARINPVPFMNKHGITHSLLVPSVLTMMRKMRVLKELGGGGILPCLKYAAFCGEALPFIDAKLFSHAAPNAKIENIYGPTEATIACTYFEFKRDTEEKEYTLGSVPIGVPNKDMETDILDDELRSVPKGETGELVLSGRQLSKGYLNDPVQTNEKFISYSGKTYYKTGDLCKMTDDGIVFLGRNDTQAQIKGYRVELYEIENALSRMDGCIDCAAIPTPAGAVNYSGLTVFILADKGGADINDMKNRLKETLPFYMIPDNFILLDTFPVNSNGKTDRNALKKMLEKGDENDGL